MAWKWQHPFLHISIDDVIKPLEDVTLHAGQYGSIFEQPDLRKLKEIHDNYGAVFTLNLFQYNNVDVDNSTFHLAMITDRFKDEFKAAKSWLRFAYHSKFTNTYSAELLPDVLVESIRTVYDDIERFAGVQSIDRVPRFGFFSVSKESLMLLKRNGYIDGCLTADDERDLNCGLVGRELFAVQNHDVYIDHNDIVYFRSEHRFDNLDKAEILTLLNRLNEDENNNKYFIIFGHTVDNDKIRIICDWAVAHQIPFGYPLG